MQAWQHPYLEVSSTIESLYATCSIFTYIEFLVILLARDIILAQNFPMIILGTYACKYANFYGSFRNCRYHKLWLGVEDHITGVAPRLAFFDAADI